MNREIKQKWISALKSGKYTQGKGYLKITSSAGNHYCCLGVLCEVMEIPSYKPYKLTASSFDENTATLSTSLLSKAGLTDENQTDLINMNDEANYSFSQIADFIEEKL